MKHIKSKTFFTLFALASSMYFNTMLSSENSISENNVKNASLISMMSNFQWLPSPTKTILDASAFPVTLNNNDVLQINGPITYTAPRRQPYYTYFRCKC